MKSVHIASWLVISVLVVYILIIGKALLIPFVLAVAISYLVNALKLAYRKIPIGANGLPSWFCLTLSVLTIFLSIFLVGHLITATANAMIIAAPEYRVNLDRIYNSIMNTFGLEGNLVEQLRSTIGSFDLSSIIGRLVNTLSGLASNLFLVLIYVVFLLFEQKAFAQKMVKIFSAQGNNEEAQEVTTRINTAIQSYISVKTATSVLTGVLSYLVLAAVGVDFAVFWGFLIFLLNFIPNIGSIIATGFPVILALVQFETYTPAIIILVGVLGIQLIVGNFLEPKMMGNSLNISTVVIMLALAIWGSIWGITGMILCVPITVIMMIIFAEFPKTRPIAILLSNDGEVGE